VVVVTIGVGRAWLDLTWHPGRRGCDVHGVRWSFTCDLWAFGLQGGIERGEHEARDVGQQVVDAFHEVYGGLERLSDVRAARLDPATCPHAHVTSEETASLETERHTCRDCGKRWMSELPQ
jgi:hypothetical protein